MGDGYEYVFTKLKKPKEFVGEHEGDCPCKIERISPDGTKVTFEFMNIGEAFFAGFPLQSCKNYKPLSHEESLDELE